MNTLASDRKLNDWEARWAPYDESTYQAVLQAIRPDDLVLDIGAGDLRLACRMAAICRGVIAIEMQPALLRGQAASPIRIHPDNLTIMEGDARLLEFPKGITTGVLLMRHCTHYQLYASKLKKAGARRLITNARWRMDVEVVDLRAPALTYAQARPGWFACDCGAIGFKTGPVEAITPETMLATTQVRNCPTCDPGAVSSLN